MSSPAEVSIVMPCLNEADTLEACILKAQQGLRDCGVRGEVVVADNGSTDGSREIATRLGARLVPVPERGYGCALMAGIEAAEGAFIIMGDADDSYDFREAPRFVARWREGAELVQGCRLPAGGGTVKPGAMPWLHRWWGNPMFTLLARTWFRAPIHDIYCGLRGFTPELYRRLRLRCTGMEFATEMIIKASLFGARISEVPITLHPDGRKAHAPHLKTFRDGWRTLRFFLLFCPRWLFLIPGLLLVALGVLGYALALPGVTIGGATLDAHTLLFASMFILCGYQAALFSAFTNIFATREGFMPRNHWVEQFFRTVTLERGLLVATFAMAVGISLLVAATAIWWQTGFGELDYARTMRLVVPGATLTALGFQTFLSSFLVSVLGMERRN